MAIEQTAWKVHSAKGCGMKNMLAVLIVTLGTICHLVFLVAVFLCSLVLIVICWETLKKALRR